MIDVWLILTWPKLVPDEKRPLRGQESHGKAEQKKYSQEKRKFLASPYQVEWVSILTSLAAWGTSEPGSDRGWRDRCLLIYW